LTEVNKQDEKISGTQKHLPFCDEKVAKGEIESFVLMGELSLDGTLQPVKGVLPIALRAREEGFKGVIVPLKNAREVALVGGGTFPEQGEIS
jgi:predicted ATPase with chaperone activity